MNRILNESSRRGRVGRKAGRCLARAREIGGSEGGGRGTRAGQCIYIQKQASTMGPSLMLPALMLNAVCGQCGVRSGQGQGGGAGAREVGGGRRGLAWKEHPCVICLLKVRPGSRRRVPIAASVAVPWSGLRRVSDSSRA